MFSATRASCGASRRGERKRCTDERRATERTVSLAERDRPRSRSAADSVDGPGAKPEMHSVPQPRFSVDYTPVVRLSDKESLRNRSSPCTAAPEPKVPRATRETKNEYAQTAKGTPLCKHRGMPSETLVRNSSHSSPRAFVSPSSSEKREKPVAKTPSSNDARRRPFSNVVRRERKKKLFATRAGIRASVRTASPPSSSVCSVSADSSAHAARRSAASGNRSEVAYAAIRPGTRWLRARPGFTASTSPSRPRPGTSWNTSGVECGIRV